MSCNELYFGVFKGWTSTQLDATIFSIQNAIIDLTTGNKGESFAYTQGNGSKSVTYTRADIGALRALLQEAMQARYGGIARRRPIGLSYR